MTHYQRIGAGVSGAIIALLAAAAMAFPEWRDPAHAFLAQEGILEQFQWPCYLIGAALLIRALPASPAPTRGALLWLLFIHTILCLRELDLDRTLWLERWYNPTQYIGDDDIPLTGQVVMGAAFAVAVAALGRLFARHRRALRAWRETRDWRSPASLYGTAIACFVIALLCDKYSTLRRHTGIDLSGDYRMYVEESLELVGAALFWVGAADVASQERNARRIP